MNIKKLILLSLCLLLIIFIPIRVYSEEKTLLESQIEQQENKLQGKRKRFYA